jgi:hypothetical protein
MAIDYRIRFNLKGSSPMVVLEDITNFGQVNPTTITYTLQITYPSGYKSTQTGTLNAQAKVNMVLDLTENNFPPYGEYTFVYTTSFNEISTLSKTGIYSYIRPVANLVNLFDEFVPTLKVQDQTDYGIQNFNISTQSRSIVASSTFLNQTVSSSTTFLDIKFNNKYYDTPYTVTLNNELTYVGTLSSWMFIDDKITQTETMSPDVPPSGTVLLGFIKQLKADMDAQDGVSLSEYSRLKDVYVTVISTLEHTIIRYRNGDTSGLTSYIKKIYELLRDTDYIQNADTNTEITPYNFDIFAGVDWADIANKPFLFSNLTNNQILRYNSTEGKFVNLDWNYVHTQSDPSSSWSINHNLNKYPAVTIVDTAGTEVEGNVSHTGPNGLTITFAAPFSGKAYIN